MMNRPQSRKSSRFAINTFPIESVLIKSALLILITVLAACNQDATNPARVKPPVQVSTTTLKLAQAGDYATYPARVQGLREVEVRAQVSGILQKRLYREGQLADAGTALFQIDPEPYQLAVKQAQAVLDEAHANLQQAKQDWQRQADLFRRAMTSAQNRDTAEARKDMAMAQVAKAENALLDAQRLLRYTTVKAPVNGTVGMETVSEGNLVSDGALLSTVTQLDPVQVHFSIPSRDAVRLRQTPSDQAQTIQLLLANGEVYEHSGQLDFSDVRIDPTTDRVAMRAVFPNPDHKFLAGQFVRVKVLLDLYQDVLLIDPTAVSEGPAGPQVYLLGSDNRAKVTPVRLGPVLNGQQVVLDGLAAGDTLIVNGHHQLRDGAAVITKPAPEKP